MIKKYPFNNENLSLDERINDLLSRLTLDEKIKMLTTKHFAVERLGIKEFGVGLEIARGYVGREKDKFSTVFPQPIGMASTFDTDLMERIGDAAGDEARAYFNKNKESGLHGLMIWGPTVDMERHPLWGRTEEAYGEDPCLTGEMTTAYTKGLAGVNDGVNVMKTIPTLKHFCANNNEHHRGSSSSNLEIRQRHEYYYAAFEPAITRGGAYSIMTAYNELCHEPASINKDIQTILKDKWGLGYVVTDGGDFSQNVTDHKCFSSHAESLAKCLKAGNDCMTDDHELVHNSAYKALNDGLMTIADIDKAVYNALDARFNLGLFDETCPYDDIKEDVIDSEKHRKLNLEASLKGVTLLKNNGILPLDTNKKMKIAVVGPLSNVNLRDWYTGTFTYKTSIVDGIREEFPNAEIVLDTAYDIVAIKCSNGKYLSAKADGSVTADAETVTDSEMFEKRCWDNSDKWSNLFSTKYQRFVIADHDNNTLKLGSDEVFAWFTPETFSFIYTSNDENFIEDYLHHKRFAVVEDKITLLEEYSKYDEKIKFNIKLISAYDDRLRIIAEDVDLAVVCVGNDPIQTAKECYDRENLNIIDSQSSLDYEFLANSVPVVYTIVSSYPYAFKTAHKDAVIYTSHAGAELGNAVAQTLSGKNNPAGRTPMTWYASDSQLPDIMEYDIRKGKLTYQYFDGKPLFPFGFGLSYSRFDYKSMKIIDNKDSIRVEAVVENVSDIDGDEVVQLYYSAIDSVVYRPIKKLCAFKRVHIKAHSSETVILEFLKRELKFWNADNEDFFLEDCLYKFMLGASSEDIRLTETTKINGAMPVPKRNLRRITSAYKCDDMKGGGFFYSLKHDCIYFKATKWVASLEFDNMDFSDASEIEITASTSAERRNIYINIGEFKTTITVPASDGNDDFKTFRARLDIIPNSTEKLIISTEQGCCIKDLAIK